MVQRLCTSLEFPYAHFATDGTTADVLYPIVWEAVHRIVYCGLNVIAFTCDGASPNHEMHKVDTSKELVYTSDRDIFFFSDVPHLIKTVGVITAIKGSFGKYYCHNAALTKIVFHIALSSSSIIERWQAHQLASSCQCVLKSLFSYWSKLGA